MVKKFDRDEAERVMAEYVDSTGILPSAEALAEELECSVATARRLLRLQGPDTARSRIQHAEIFQFITEYISKNGWAPSQREIAEACGVSVNTVNIKLERMVQEGLIEVGRYPRQVKIVGAVMKEGEMTL